MYGGVVVHLAVDVSIGIIIILLGFVSLVIVILRSGEKSTLLLLNRDLSILRRRRTTTRKRFSQYLVVCLHEPESFWRENAIAVIILLQILAKMA